MTYIEDLGRQAKAAARVVRLLSAQAKNDALEAIAVALLEQQTEILAANERDLENGRQNGLTTALLERLTLTEARIQGMVDGLRQIAALPDPILKTEIVNNLTTNDATKPLSAKQGKILQDNKLDKTDLHNLLF